MANPLSPQAEILLKGMYDAFVVSCNMGFKRHNSKFMDPPDQLRERFLPDCPITEFYKICDELEHAGYWGSQPSDIICSETWLTDEGIEYIESKGK